MATRNLFLGRPQQLVEEAITLLQFVPVTLLNRVELRRKQQGEKLPEEGSEAMKSMSRVYLIQPPQGVIKAGIVEGLLCHKGLGPGSRSTAGSVDHVVAINCARNGWRVESVYLRPADNTEALPPSEEEIDMFLQHWPTNNQARPVDNWMQHLNDTTYIDVYDANMKNRIH